MLQGTTHQCFPVVELLGHQRQSKQITVQTATTQQQQHPHLHQHQHCQQEHGILMGIVSRHMLVGQLQVLLTCACKNPHKGDSVGYAYLPTVHYSKDMLHSSLQLGKRRSIDTRSLHSNYHYDGDEEGLLSIFTDTHDSNAAARHNIPFISQLRQSVMGLSHIMDHSPFTVQVMCL